MSTPVNETTAVTFDLCGKCLTFPPTEVEGLALGLLATASMVHQAFRNITIARTVGDEKPNSKSLNNLKMWKSTGPFSPVQMVQMMQYKKGISNDAWLAHMNQFIIIQEMPPLSPPNRIKSSKWT